MNPSDVYQEIYESAVKFLVPQNKRETYMTIVKEAMDLTNATDGSIFSYEDEELKRVYTTNNKLKKIKPREGGISYRVFEEGIPRLRLKDGLVEANADFKKMKYISDISVPLNYGHITIGVLSVLSTKKLTTEEMNKLMSFAPLATMAIRNAQLHQELEKAIEKRDLFISMAAHELKNPLTTIKLNNQILQRSEKLKKMPEYARLNTIEKAVDSLDSLTSELLQIDRIRTGKLQYNFEKVDMIELTKSVVLNSRQRYTNYTFVFSNKSKKNKLVISADKDKMIQVITNIINNAVKFSEEKTSVNISITVDKNKLVIRFKDQGVGIDKENIKKLFTKFYRGSSQKEGMGLGLFLVKQIVDRHSGTIDIKSKVGSGTTVIISLPISYKTNGKR